MAFPSAVTYEGKHLLRTLGNVNVDEDAMACLPKLRSIWQNHAHNRVLNLRMVCLVSPGTSVSCDGRRGLPLFSIVSN